MKIKKKNLFIVICMLSVFFISDNMLRLDAQVNDIVAIVNPSLGSVSKAQIQQIYKGIIRQLKGSDVKILFNSDDKINDAFARNYLGMSGSGMESLWINLKIREGVSTPRKVPSAVVKSLVAGSAVFVGFVNRSEAGTEVKIVE